MVKLLLSGMPVETASATDWVEMDVAATVAVTRTEVFTAPEFTTVCTWPLALVVALVWLNEMPPTLVLSVKSTAWFGTTAPDWSNTVNTTVEVSDRPLPPVPCNAITSGVAEVNWIEPTVAGCTVTFACAA